MLEKPLPMYQYSVHTVNGGFSDQLQVVASYVRTEGGFLEFKNSSHEVVLMVNANHVMSVSRSFSPVSEPRLANGGAVAMSRKEVTE